MKERTYWLVIAGLVVLLGLSVWWGSRRQPATGVEARVDTVLREAPGWRDSVQVWAARDSLAKQAEARLRHQRDAALADAQRWHAAAEASDSGAVGTQPDSAQAAYWHTKYLARTREQMATLAALNVETMRADSAAARADSAGAHLQDVSAQLTKVTAALKDYRETQQCRIGVGPLSVGCPSRTTAFLVGVGTGLAVRTLVGAAGG
jgi:hypothetical protein